MPWPDGCWHLRQQTVADEPRRYGEFRRRAESMVESPGRLQSLTRQAAGKLTSAGGGKFREMRDQLTLGIALIKAWLAGDYRDVSRSTIVAVAAALLYFVVPLDVVPDFLFGWGFLDDAAVLGYVFSQLQSEIEAFRAFQERGTLGQDEDKESEAREEDGGNIW